MTHPVHEEIEFELPATAPAAEEPAPLRIATAGAPAGTPDELVFEAKQRITLRCGKSSITLHPNGKIVIKGDYIVSDAEGTNRIVGGQIQIN